MGLADKRAAKRDLSDEDSSLEIFRPDLELDSNRRSDHRNETRLMGAEESNGTAAMRYDSIKAIRVGTATDS
jgi:hypothetical protein